ncbi:MAG: hypothetical protein ACRD5F_08685 [Candidatus Acidiferrales bacterium]
MSNVEQVTESLFKASDQVNRELPRQQDAAGNGPTKEAAQVRWPGGKAFAFTVFDDTDNADLSNVPYVYDLLHDLGFRTTKSVWPVRGERIPSIGGATCEDRSYLDWVHSIQKKGFEIASHNATYHTSSREETALGLTRFASLFGHNPRTHANHHDCRESIYWGNYRVTDLNELVYNVLTRFRRRGEFEGQFEKSPLFWGDLCKEKVQYVRNFIFFELNTLKACPQMPYHDARRPYVNYWFASTEGRDLESFVTRMAEKNQDRLEAEGGACIMYTHFASRFVEGRRVNQRFRELMKRLSRKNGYFIPVSELLDYFADSARPHGAHRRTA